MCSQFKTKIYFKIWEEKLDSATNLVPGMGLKFKIGSLLRELEKKNLYQTKINTLYIIKIGSDEQSSKYRRDFRM